MSVKSIVKSLFNYPVGPQRYDGAIDWYGPASYAVVVPGTPPSAGDQITAAAFGLKTIHWIGDGGSQDGYFQVVPIRLNNTTWILEWRALKTATVGGQNQTTGLEAVVATNMSSTGSASIVRLYAIGM